MVGDASLDHYAAFLLDSGWKPYVQIKDMNLPGAYLDDWLVMHLLGPGAMAERLFDFALSAVSACAAWWLSPRRYRAAGLFAATMFFLLHARDGIVQTGQRDWVITVLALLAVGAWIHTTRSGRAPWLYVFAGTLLGVAVITKPPALLFTLPLIVERLWAARREGRHAIAAVPGLLLGAGLALPVTACALWLARDHALSAFFLYGIPMMRYYACLQRLPAMALIAHGISGVRLPILLGIGLLPFAWRLLRGMEFALICAEAGMGFTYFSVQGKGYAYQRYPFAFFLLEVLGLIFIAALSSEKAWMRWTGCGALCICCVWLAPQAALRALRYRRDQDQFGTMLRADLTQLGGRRLDRHIQCLDAFSGCIRVLYEQRLQPSTGWLYDQFLFGAAGDPVVKNSRATFERELIEEPPRVFVITPQNNFGGPDSYFKVRAWPWFADFLSENYRQCAERTPTVPQLWEGTPRVPLGYRIYVRKADFSLCAAIQG